MDDHWNVPVCRFDPTGAYPEPRPHPFDPGTGTVEMQGKRFDEVASGTHSSELFADATIEFLLGRAGSGARARAGGAGCPPFFAYLSFMAPHDPRTMPQRFLTMYDPDRMPLPDAFLPEHPFDIGWRGRDELLESYPRTPAAIRRHIAEYYAMISHLDAEMGRVIDALRSTGELDNTIIVFAGDNGLALGQHGLMGKQSTYEHSVHVPLLMAGPGIARGERRQALCYLLDIYPTLCDMLGVAAPASVEGRSLRPALADPDAAVRDRLHFAYQDLHRAVTDGRYKLIEWVVDGERHTQLFDHTPPIRASCTMLRGLPEQGDNLRRLRGELRELRERWDDPADNVWQSTGARELDMDLDRNTIILLCIGFIIVWVVFKRFTKKPQQPRDPHQQRHAAPAATPGDGSFDLDKWFGRAQDVIGIMADTRRTESRSAVAGDGRGTATHTRRRVPAPQRRRGRRRQAER